MLYCPVLNYLPNLEPQMYQPEKRSKDIYTTECLGHSLTLILAYSAAVHHSVQNVPNDSLTPVTILRKCIYIIRPYASYFLITSPLAINFRSLFPYNHFNRFQSECFDKVRE